MSPLSATTSNIAINLGETRAEPQWGSTAELPGSYLKESAQLEEPQEAPPLHM